MKTDRRAFLGLLTVLPSCARLGQSRQTLHVIPNFHPGCMGWLAPYHVERNYCPYAYLDHQDLALQDPDYRYVVSEIPHLITMLERHPDRFRELQRLESEGKVEMVHAFVVEPTVNLSGGEALVMQGVEGLRWYDQVMGQKPRHCWMIDVTGWHEQMAQIVHGLGLETFVYCRYNPTGDAKDRHGIAEEMDSIHWLESPDGTRVLAVNPNHYSEAFRPLMRATEPLPPNEVIREIADTVALQRKRMPEGAPLLAFAGQEDYSLSFNYKGYPAELLQIWKESEPDAEIRFSTLSDWYDAFRPGDYELKTVKSGSRIYGWTGSWVNAPVAKQWYRRCEHRLQAAESLATIASLSGGSDYPAQDFSNSWLLLALNMDRAELWCVAVEGVYSDPNGWDIKDRYEMVDEIASRASAGAFDALQQTGGAALGLFNPSGWKRDELVELELPAGKAPRDAPAQFLEDGKTALVRAELPALGAATLPLRDGSLPPPSVRLPALVDTEFYTAQVDPRTAALTSLKLKPSGRELLSGPANEVYAAVRNEQDAKQVFAHQIPPKADRVTDVTSGGKPSAIRVSAGPLATIVEAVCPFKGGRLRRVMRFYADSPRIDFVTETNDLPHGTIVSAEFPLADEITQVRRGIPYGFSHGAWSQPNPDLHGINKDILPVIRWSHYELAGGGGVALLDRGVPGRELVGQTPILVLHNATEVYYWDRNVSWMSGRSRQTFEYALVAHDGDWSQAGILQMAWNYNAKPVVFAGSARVDGTSYLETSGNMVLQALRRTGDEIEIRMVECFGSPGEATVKVALPHSAAALTNLMGGERSKLDPTDGEYRFPVRPQQIVTLRLRTEGAVAPVQALTTFDPVVPEAKRVATRGFDHPALKGHPPRKPGEEEEWKKLGG